MTYKIEQIEGIGPSYGERLGAAGVHTSDDLLTQCATPAGRQKLAEVTGLSADQILTWANQADLMRVSGVGSEYGQLLEASSVLQQMEEGKEQDLSNVSRDKWAEILEKMSPDDFKYKM